MMGRKLLYLLSALLISPILQLTSSDAAAAAQDRYLLTGPDSQALKEMVESSGGRTVSRLRYHSGWVIELDSAQAFRVRNILALRAMTQLNGLHGASSDQIELLERDKEMHLIDAARPAIVSNDPSLFTSQKTPWGIRMVHAPEAFDISRGKAVTVCVVDTGIQTGHPDLKDAIVGGDNTLTHPEDPGQDLPLYEDDQGHGTHVAGTIAARDNEIGVVGVAPEAKIFAVKSLNSRGSGSFSTVAEGIRSCIAHGAQVINLSCASDDDSEVIRRAVNDAIHEGVVIVAAAGNEKSGVKNPARLPGVIAVSALSKNHDLARFSNRGPEISFIAPGEEILSTYIRGSYAYMQGTSQAAPHVTGVVALLIAAGANPVLEHIRTDDLGLAPEAQGQGCIDAYKSLEN